MATELDKLVVKIEADLSSLKKGMAQANKEVQNGSKSMSRGLAGLNNSLTKIRASMLKFGAIAGIAFGALALRNIIKTGMEIQGLEIRFNNLFGSVEEGNKAFKQLIEFAGTVPFSLKEIQAGSGSLAVVAKDAEHLRDIMEITGNVSVIAGLDFATTASQIQRVFAGGLAAADIFREKGITQIIRDTGMMTDTVEGAAAAFEAVFSGNGKFANATDEMAETIEGTFSMIGDTIQAFTIAVAEGFFVELTNSLQEFNEMLQNNRADIVAYGKSLGEDLGATLKLVKDNIDLVIAAFNAFIAMQIGSLFFKYAQGATALAASMGLLNAAMAANPVLFTATVISSIAVAMGFLISRYVEWDRVIDNLNTSMKLFLKLTGQSLTLIQRQGNIGDIDMRAYPSTLSTQSSFNVDDAGFGGQEARFKNIKVAEKKITALTNEQYHERQKNMSIYMEAMAEARGKDFDAEMEIIEKLNVGFEDVGKSISTAFGEAVISGKDFKDSMVDIFQSVAQQVVGLIFQLRVIDPLLKSIKESMGVSAVGGGVASLFPTLASSMFGGFKGANMIMGGLSGPSMPLGARAGGGSVNPNMPYMVGERGAEMFVPKSAGTIVPNNQVGGAGGGNIVIEQNLNFATGVSQTVRAEVMNLLPAIQQSTLSAVQDARLRGGTFAKDFGA